MSVIVLSCADNNVRPINYSNETVKNNEIELSKLEDKNFFNTALPKEPVPPVIIKILFSNIFFLIMCIFYIFYLNLYIS